MKMRSMLMACLCPLLTAVAQDEPKPPGGAAVPALDPSAPAVRVLSRSKQFRVSGGSSVSRGVCAILAEEAKDQFLQLIEEVDGWKIPVSIVLHGEPGDTAPRRTVLPRLLLVENSHRLRLDKHLGAGLEAESFRQAVTEMLVYERSLRGMEQVPEDLAMAVPPWLAVGLREASAWRMQQSDRRMYAAMFKQGGAFKVDDLFTMDSARHEQLDEASRVAFRVSAGSMVMALLEQPQGLQGFRNFLGEVASFQGEMPFLLRKHFPELNLSQNSLAKWWRLQLANQGGLNLLTDVMTVAETEEWLEKSLFLEIPTADGESEQVGIDQWRRLSALQDQAQRIRAVKPAQASLVQLSYRCFPSYRPLLLEYQKLLIRLSHGQTDAAPAALEELTKARKVMLTKAARGRDFLDWFEITRARETSGAFDDYLRLKEQLKTRDNTREDPVSKYLDRLDAAFGRAKD